VLAGITVKSTPLALEPRAVPPVATVYQAIRCPAEVAFRLDAEPLQTMAGVAVAEVDAAGSELTINSPEIALVAVPQVPVTTQ
jgi:hypothetical protein